MASRMAERSACIGAAGEGSSGSWAAYRGTICFELWPNICAIVIGDTPAAVMRDVSGVTGQAIIKAILAGERDPQKLGAFRDPRVKASEQDIARSLEGNWQEDLLFVLKQEQAAFEFCRKQMAECDRQLEQYLQKMEDRSQGATLPKEKRKDRLQKKKGNQPQFDLQQQFFRMTGTDLTQIDGIDVMTATTILSEAGWDMIKWKDEDHFVSWLRLAPDNRISGDRIIGKGRLPTSNRVTGALKLAASSPRTSQSYLGAQFRRLRARLDTRLRSRPWPPS
jgi:transposase